MLNTVSLEELSIFYGLHVLVSSSIAIVGARLLQRRYSDSLSRNFFFLLLFNLALPIIGYIFSIYLVVYMLKVTYEKKLKNAKTINLEELDQEFPTVKRAFGEGSMVDLMADVNAPAELRMKALSTMAENMSRQNVGVIKNALSEKNDEIRLYSFSLIDNMERGINGKIHQATLLYNNPSNDEEKYAAAKDLAFLYWEMIYFDLSDEVLKKYLIEESFKYAKIVLKADINDTNINVLLGKIYLEKGEPEEATTKFIMAIENGKDAEYIVPYLAELYFNAGNYKTVRSMFSSLKNLSLNSTMHPVVEQWRTHG